MESLYIFEITLNSICKIGRINFQTDDIGKNCHFFLSCVLVCILLIVGISPVFAQSGSGWSEPLLLSGTESGNMSPSLTTGPSEHVYAAWIYNSLEETETIGSIYVAAGQGGEWGNPVDVIAPYGNHGLSNLKACASNDGYLYLMWQEQSVWISSAPINDVLNLHAWSEPVEVISPLGIGVGIADLAIDNSGVLHVAYPDGQIVNYTFSLDGGLTWSSPVIIGGIQDPEQVIHGSQIAVDNVGRIFVAWNALQLPDGWPPQGVYVASSGDGGQTWQVKQLEGSNHNYVSIAISENNEVHLVWNTAGGLGGRYHSVSRDGGVFWSMPDRFTELSGSTQLFVMLMFDPWGTLHLATIADGTIDGTRHSQSPFYMSWNGTWSSPELIVSLPKGDANRIAMTVSEGNIIHVLWQQGDGGIWYSKKVTNAPTLPIHSVPDATPVLKETEVAVLMPTHPIPFDAGDSSLQWQETEAASSRGDLTPIFLAAVSVVAFIGISAVIVKSRKRF